MVKIPPPDSLPEPKPTLKEVVGYSGIYDLLEVAREQPGEPKQAIAEIQGKKFVVEFEAKPDS